MFNPNLSHNLLQLSKRVKHEEMNIYEVLEVLRLHIPKWIDILPDDVVWHIYSFFMLSANGMTDILNSRLQWMAFVGRKHYQHFVKYDTRLSKALYTKGLLPILLLAIESAKNDLFNNEMKEDFTMHVKDYHGNFLKLFIDQDMDVATYVKKIVLESDAIVDTMSDFRISLHRNILAYRIARNMPLPFKKCIHETISLQDHKNGKQKDIVIRYTNADSFWHMNVTRKPTQT